MRQNEYEIARQSLALFGVSGTFRRIAKGLDVSYRVKTEEGKVYALRVSKGPPSRPVSAFQIEAEWIDALSSNPWFRVPKLHWTEAGTRVGQVEDATGVVRASTLLSWHPGRRCYLIGILHARALGQMAGALHQRAKATQVPSTDAIKTWDAELMCGMFKKGAIDSFEPEVAELVRDIHGNLRRITATLAPLETGLINADVGLHNILWRNGRASLVDFNDTGIGPFAFCLGRLVERIRLHERGVALADELLQGYREVTPLPAAYENWGSLFELAAAVFKLNFSTERVARGETILKAHEKRTLKALKRTFVRLEL